MSKSRTLGYVWGRAGRIKIAVPRDFLPLEDVEFALRLAHLLFLVEGWNEVRESLRVPLLWAGYEEA